MVKYDSVGTYSDFTWFQVYKFEEETHILLLLQRMLVVVMVVLDDMLVIVIKTIVHVNIKLLTLLNHMSKH